MDFLCYVFGYYRITLHAKDYKRFFSICAYHGISFLKIDIPDDGSTEEIKVLICKVRCDQYEKLKDIANKTNTVIHTIEKQGLPVLLNRIKLHIWFLIGAAIALFLLIGLSKRVWDIQLEGNYYYGDEKFDRFLDEINIRSGMKISEIDCAKLSALIRENFDRVTWASSEIDGCRLIIHMKENRLIESEEELEETQAYDLIAEKDGVVDKILVRKGISQVETGQSVKKGDVLISGAIPIMNDALEITAYEQAVSDGDVYIQCEYAYFNEVKREWYQSVIMDETKYPMIQIGEIRFETIFPIKINKTKEKEQYLDIISEETELKLTDSFVLPVKTGYKRQVLYEKIAQFYTDSQLEELADSYFQEFCINLEKKGVQIYENNVKMDISDASCIMSGKVTVIEKTGILQKAQVPELYGDMMEE